MPFLGVCPPWPAAGPGVATELERIPYRGWATLVQLGAQAKQIKKTNTDPEIIVFMDSYLDTMDWMKPGSGFEHLWGWIDNLYDLKDQLEVCR